MTTTAHPGSDVRHSVEDGAAQALENALGVGHDGAASRYGQTSQKDPLHMSSAVVIGLCSHGLSICRALKAHGVEVYAVESNMSLPGVRTGSATVLNAANINSTDLIEFLDTAANDVFGPDKPVLFPTNDRMVRILAENWPTLSPNYRLSWSAHTNLVQDLQLKSKIEGASQRAGILHPFSRIIHSAEDVAGATADMEFPLIAKPVTPMSGFKVKLLANAAELERLCATHERDLPFVVQTWIEGDDTRLVFSSIYFEHGKPVGVFTGRKLLANPPAMGQGTVMEPFECDEATELSVELVNGTDYTGPMSVEFKIDPQGRYWLIEPNIGRTEFSVECAIKNGVNLPYIEYLSSIGAPVERVPQHYSHVWLDTEKDLTVYAKQIAKAKSLWINRKRPVFPYFNTTDWQPFFAAMARSMRRVGTATRQRLRWLTGERAAGLEAYSVERVERLSEAEEAMRAVNRAAPAYDIFLCVEWFRNYVDTVAKSLPGKLAIFTLRDADGAPLAVLPMFETRGRLGARYLESLSNYYSPHIDFLIDESKISRPRALEIIRSKERRYFRRCAQIRMSPLKEPVSAQVRDGFRRFPWRAFESVKYGNWTHSFTDLGDFDTHLSSRIKNTIRRKRKKLQSDHEVEFRIVQDRAGALATYSDYESIYNTSWKRTEAYPDFIKGLIELAANNGTLRFGEVIVDGTPAAGQIWFVYDRQAFIYKLAHDPAFSKYSVGTLLTYEMCKDAITRDGVTYIDFLTGDDRFKKDWMTSRNQLMELQICNLLSPTGAALAALATLSALKERVYSQ